MKQVWKCLAALALCAVMVCSVTVAAAEAAYGMCTADQVAVRKQPGTKANVWFYIDWGFVCEILDVVVDGNDIWYKVESPHPEDNGHTYTGYIHDDYFRPLTTDETYDYLVSEGLATVRPDSESSAESAETTLRPSVGFGGSFDVGIMTGATAQPAQTPWVDSDYGADGGYAEEDGSYADDEMWSDDRDYISEEPDYSDIVGEPVEGASGMVTSNNVNFRAEPTTNSVSLGKLSKGTAVKLLTIPPKSGTAYWYKVEHNGIDGYVHSNYIRVTNPGVTAEPTMNPADEEEDLPTDDYLPEEEDWSDIIGVPVEGATGRVTSSNVNFRSEPTTDGVSLAKLPIGAVIQLKSMPPAKGDAYWYHAVYNGMDGYVNSNYIAVLVSGVTAVPTATPAPTATPEPVITPDPVIGSPVDGATGVITASGVNFRLSPSTDGQKIGKLNAGAVVELLTIPAKVDSNHWYKIRYNGQEGYVQSNYIRVISTGSTPVPGESAYGYARLDCTSGNLRDRPGGTTMAQWKGFGTMLQIVGPAEYADGYDWYPVYYGADGNIYYVREDIIKVVDSTGAEVTPVPPAAGVYGYVITTEAGVNLRLKPNGDVVAQIRRNTVLPCIGLPETPVGSVYTWYYVEYEGVRGYLRGDCVRVCSADGGPVVSPTATPAPTATPVPGTLGYIRMIANKVNLRATPGGTVIGSLQEGLILPIAGESKAVGNYVWYCVRTPDGLVGYVRGDMLIPCNEDGSEVTVAPVPTATPGATATTAPTLSTYGYVQITASTANVRELPGTANTIVAELSHGTIWPMIGRALTSGNYTWYPITANGVTGFVRGDVAYKLTPAQEAEYLAGQQPGQQPGGSSPVVTPTPVPGYVMSDFVIVTGSKVNLRESASTDSAAPYQVTKGTVMPYDGTKMVGTYEWYAVVYEGRELFIRGDYVRVMTMNEYNDWLASSGETAPSVLGYVKFTSNNVNVRNAANGSQVIDCLKLGTIVPYFREGVDGGTTRDWYLIQTPSGLMGYVREDMVKKCASDGSALPSEPDDDTSSGGEATYTTLKLGSTGAAVTRLVTKLKELGYYTGSVTSSYTSAVRTAVMAFQADNGLTVDGIAGSETQHKLFGTVPPGSSGTSDLSFEFYPVEKIDWFTGGIQKLWPKGANFKVYDIKTGIVWWAHRWSGAYHADIEPLTAADTARLCRMYGVDDAQDIYDQNMWHRRPSLVTIGKRTFACSLDGMPHNPDGDTIPDNNMTGQICLHFTNSKGHESGAVSTSHKKAIEEAFDWAEARYGSK